MQSSRFTAVADQNGTLIFTARCHGAGSRVGAGLQVEVSSDGRQIRFCDIVDEFTREALATAALVHRR